MIEARKQAQDELISVEKNERQRMKEKIIKAKEKMETTIEDARLATKKQKEDAKEQAKKEIISVRKKVEKNIKKAIKFVVDKVLE